MPTPPHHVAPFGAVEVPGAGGTDGLCPGAAGTKSKERRPASTKRAVGSSKAVAVFPLKNLVADTMRAGLQAAYVLDDFNVSHFSKWFATRKRPMRPSRTPARYPLLEHLQPHS